jgi:hypothetical protein
MARPLRIALEDGWYQVMNRGIEQRSIFRAAADYRQLLQLLAQLPTRFGLLVHCYALLPITLPFAAANPASQPQPSGPMAQCVLQRVV